jgi:hypothetical protein
MRYVTWNIWGIAHKEEKLVSLINERKIKIAAIAESKKKCKGKWK